MNTIDHDDMDATTALRAATAPSSDELTNLHAHLASAADRAGLLDVAYTTVDSPVGTLLLAATEDGLLRISFGKQEGFDAVLETLARSVSPRILRAPERLDPTARELDEYFTGQRKQFDVPLDHRLSSGFRQRVQGYLRTIDYGQTQSYKQVAETVGSPRAARAVGTACATNPLPIVVPCHRVLSSDGSLGGYAGGLETKRTLLRLEQEG
ncbi:MAG TPA: methylated-DNA--[protein]-cysteine S-methyltransferase [Jiangellaceae bacterium]|nr:methylated-DNA--[protein]-cysteine S-methyltransferase [Jiangellaceae bacterium]